MNLWKVLAAIVAFVVIAPVMVVVTQQNGARAKAPVPFDQIPRTTMPTGESQLPKVLIEPLVGRACDYHEHGCSE